MIGTVCAGEGERRGALQCGSHTVYTQCSLQSMAGHCTQQGDPSTLVQIRHAPLDPTSQGDGIEAFSSVLMQWCMGSWV